MSIYTRVQSKAVLLPKQAKQAKNKKLGQRSTLLFIMMITQAYIYYIDTH